jgi:hypothetical protein
MQCREDDPMTPDQIRWLTWGAIQHRPKGAPRWDEPGTHKAITDHCGTWGLDVATDHVLAHARDPKARTPFAIKGNRPAAGVDKPVARPPKPSDCCQLCGRDMHAPDVVCDRPTKRPPAKTATTAAEVARLRALLTSDAHQPTTEQGAQT